MKTFTLSFLLCFGLLNTQAQDYQISFAAIGAAISIDSVNVENLTQGTSKKLSGSDILHLTSTVGINELKAISDNTLHIYPNPINGACSVDFEATAQGRMTFGLYTISGKRILQLQEFVSKGPHTYNLSGIGRGIYMLKVESANFSYASKIVSINGSNGKAELKHLAATSDVNAKNTSSNTRNVKSLESENSVINMQYNTGDQLKLTGKSGIYCTVFMLVPGQTQTVIIKFVSCTDADKNNYSAVQIGTQTWMLENLKTTLYRNADTIPNVIDVNKWSSLTTGALCNYNDDTAIGTKYGKLYNWFAVVDSRNIAPAGWHVPTDDEWTTLENYMEANPGTSGSTAKSLAAKSGWASSISAGAIGNNLSNNNSSGFSALPAGSRGQGGAYYSVGITSYWWSSTESHTGSAWARYLDYEYPSLYRNGFGYTTGCGFSVRCVRNAVD